jgi:hypothetical protein
MILIGAAMSHVGSTSVHCASPTLARSNVVARIVTNDALRFTDGTYDV